MNYELRIMRKRIFVDLKAGFRLRVINQKFQLRDDPQLFCHFFAYNSTNIFCYTLNMKQGFLGFFWWINADITTGKG